MSADKLPRYMSNEYLADPANVLAVLAGRLEVAREWTEDAAGMANPGDQLGRVVAELQLLARVARQASGVARRLATMSAAERERVQAMLRAPSGSDADDPQARGR